MAWNGAGTFVLNSLYSPEVNGTTIDANRYNGLMADLAAGITNCLAKDGQNTATANIPMGGFKLTGLGEGSAAGQALTYNQTTDARLTALGIGVQPSFPIDVRLTANSSGDATTTPQTVARFSWIESAGQNLGAGEGVKVLFGARLEADGSTTEVASFETYKFTAADDRASGFRIIAAADGNTPGTGDTRFDCANGITKIDVNVSSGAIGYVDFFSQSVTTSTTSAVRVCSPTSGLPTAQIYAEEGQIMAGNGTAARCGFGFLSNPDAGLTYASGALQFFSGAIATTKTFEVTELGSIILGERTVLATTATDGFAYVPRCAGVPTGVPTTVTGKTPIVVDSTNNRFYVYVGGAWRYAALV